MGQQSTGVWAVGAFGTIAYRVWGTGHMGNRYIECRLYGAIGYRGYGVKGYGHMGQ